MEQTPDTLRGLDIVDEDGEVRDGFTQVQRDVDDSWRHGVRVTQVFRREADATYWRAVYRLSTDQETNELREGLAVVTRVYPFEVTATRYLEKAPA